MWNQAPPLALYFLTGAAEAMTILPKTLLQIANAPLDPSPLERSALVVIDAQLEYVDGVVPLKGIARAIREARHLLELAREHRIPVFHVLHHGRPGAPAFDPDGRYAAFIPDLAPLDG